jgi:hypothetical protein
MECKQTKNLGRCTRGYDGRLRSALCCECVSYHLKARQLRGCFFSPDAERTYDRSPAHFARLVAGEKFG